MLCPRICCNIKAHKYHQGTEEIFDAIGQISKIPASLVEARLTLGLTQTDLANAINCSPQHISRMEKSGYKSISLAKALKLAQILCTSRTAKSQNRCTPNVGAHSEGEGRQFAGSNTLFSGSDADARSLMQPLKEAELKEAALEDAIAEGGEDQVDREFGGAIAGVESRVEFDDVDGADHLRLS